MLDQSNEFLTGEPLELLRLYAQKLFRYYTIGEVTKFTKVPEEVFWSLQDPSTDRIDLETAMKIRSMKFREWEGDKIGPSMLERLKGLDVLLYRGRDLKWSCNQAQFSNPRLARVWGEKAKMPSLTSQIKRSMAA